MRRLTIGLLGGALVVAACGGSDSTSADPTTAPVTEAPADPAEEPAADTEASAEAPADEVEEPAPETTAPTPAEPEPEPEPETDGEAAPAEPDPTTTLAPEPAAAPLGGRELGEALRPASTEVDNPFPDLLVDDVRRGTKVNVANILPAELPVLVWAWAPH